MASSPCAEGVMVIKRQRHRGLGVNRADAMMCPRAE